MIWNKSVSNPPPKDGTWILGVFRNPSNVHDEEVNVVAYQYWDDYSAYAWITGTSKKPMACSLDDPYLWVDINVPDEKEIVI